MDREQEEMQFLGLFGIYAESYKIILSWRKLFSQITLSLILPLSFIFLAHVEVSDLLFSKILHNEFQLDQTPNRHQILHPPLRPHLLRVVLPLALQVRYFTFLLVFSLLSTAAVVYVGRDITFACRDIKVWKKLMVWL